MTNKLSTDRPRLAADDASNLEAKDAVARLVADLQAGWDQHDANLSNRYFAEDIMWGSPFGATVNGYEDLHAIHTRLKKKARGGLLRDLRSLGFSRLHVTWQSRRSDAWLSTTAASPSNHPMISKGRSRRWHFTY